jgi:hypothetical protein
LAALSFNEDLMKPVLTLPVAGIAVIAAGSLPGHR